MEKLQDVKYLDMSFNSLSGEVPPTFSRLMMLETLILDNKDMYGTIPDKACDHHIDGK